MLSISVPAIPFRRAIHQAGSTEGIATALLPHQSKWEPLRYARLADDRANAPAAIYRLDVLLEAE